MRILSKIIFFLPIIFSGYLSAQHHLPEYSSIFAPRVEIGSSFDTSFPSHSLGYSLCTTGMAVAAACKNQHWYVLLAPLPFYQNGEGKKLESDSPLAEERKICTKCHIGPDALLKQYKYLFQIITKKSYPDVPDFIIDQYAAHPPQGNIPAIRTFWSFLADTGLSKDTLNGDSICQKARNFFAAMLIRDYVGSDTIQQSICEGLAKAGLLTKEEQLKLGMNTQEVSAIAVQNTGAHLDSHNKPYMFVDKEAEAKMIARFREAFLDALKNSPEKEAAEAVFPLQTCTPAFTVVKDNNAFSLKKPLSPVYGKTIVARFWQSAWRGPVLGLCAVGTLCYLVKKSDPRNWRLGGWLQRAQDGFAAFAAGSFFSRAPSIRAISAANSFE